jgi:hypothetical protein
MRGWLAEFFRERSSSASKREFVFVRDRFNPTDRSAVFDGPLSARLAWAGSAGNGLAGGASAGKTLGAGERSL